MPDLREVVLRGGEIGRVLSELEPDTDAHGLMISAIARSILEDWQADVQSQRNAAWEEIPNWFVGSGLLVYFPVGYAFEFLGIPVKIALILSLVFGGAISWHLYRKEISKIEQEARRQELLVIDNEELTRSVSKG